MIIRIILTSCIFITSLRCMEELSEPPIITSGIDLNLVSEIAFKEVVEPLQIPFQRETLKDAATRLFKKLKELPDTPSSNASALSCLTQCLLNRKIPLNNNLDLDLLECPSDFSRLSQVLTTGSIYSPFLKDAATVVTILEAKELQAQNDCNSLYHKKFKILGIAGVALSFLGLAYVTSDFVKNSSFDFSNITGLANSWWQQTTITTLLLSTAASAGTLLSWHHAKKEKYNPIPDNLPLAKANAHYLSCASTSKRFPIDKDELIDTFKPSFKNKVKEKNKHQ